MNRIINRLPLQWQSPAREVIRYALGIEPIEYLTNALVVPILGVILIGFVFLNASLLLKLCVAFGGLNVLMAVVVMLHKLRTR